MTHWTALAGIMESRLDYTAATNQPPELIGVEMSRSAFLAVRPKNPPVSPQRSYRWRLAEMGLLAQESPHPAAPKTQPTDVTSWLWPEANPYPEDAQWVKLDHFGVEVGNPRASSRPEGLRDLLDPVWYEPVWGSHGNGETVLVADLVPELVEEYLRFAAPGDFFCSPKVEAVRVSYDQELGIVTDITSFVGDEEVGWLRLQAVHRLA